VNAIVVGVADTPGVVTDIVTPSVCVPAVEAIEIVPVQVVPAASPD
jgi:hypothetical protein